MPSANATERELRIIEVMLSLSCASDSGFDASYESIGEMAGVNPHWVLALVWQMKASEMNRSGFLEVKAVEKAHGSDKKAVRRFRMFYPDRDAHWHVRMRSLDSRVRQFAEKRMMLDCPLQEIERAYVFHADEVLKASKILLAVDYGRPDFLPQDVVPDEDELEEDQTHQGILERLDRIEMLLRKLVKARAFEERTVPFEEEAESF